jgi:ABC-2 type transport system permease protein
MMLLFGRFGSLHDYTLGEVAMCFAVVNLGYAIAKCCARGFDSFSRLIAGGDFDRLLLRPRSLALQVLGSQFEITKVGRMVFGLIALGIAVANLSATWTAMRCLCLVLMVLGGAGIITSVFVLGSTLCFVTIQGLEVISLFTDGARLMTGYPLTIYGKWVARFFTFVIPLATVNYLPLLYLTGRAENPWYALMPLIGVLYVFPCLWVWYRGARKYMSTGS